MGNLTATFRFSAKQSSISERDCMILGFQFLREIAGYYFVMWKLERARHDFKSPAKCGTERDKVSLNFTGWDGT